MARSVRAVADPSRVEPSAILDRFILPVAACAFAVIVQPLILFFTTAGVNSSSTAMVDVRYENKIFWPVLAVIAIILVAGNPSRRIKLAPHLVWFCAYLTLAGLSAVWAYAPASSFIRFVQQLMVCASVLLPAMMASRTADMMRGLFWCVAVAAILNFCFTFAVPQQIVDGIAIGNPGYFLSKNYLGECCGIAFLLSLHEICYPGARRWFGILVAIIAVADLFLANSKTALALAVFAPTVAGFALALRKWKGVSPAMLLFVGVCLYLVASSVSNFNVYRLSYMLYGDSTFTGRKTIWDFANSEIDVRPLLGWGYQSFWLVGPDAPSVLEAPGWVKNMPNAHNGYLDSMLELGWVGFAMLVAFLFASLHAAARVFDQDRARGGLLLSLILYIMISNGLETTWMRGFEFLWIVFLFVTAESARHGLALPSTSRMQRPTRAGPRRVSPSFGAARPMRPRPRPRTVPTIGQAR